MAAPILLVADDLSLIAAVKRVLAREGRECVLATSAADAVIGFGHGLPGLVLLQPSVESDRGRVVLEELQHHPDAQLLKVVLLGETVPGFAWPVEPLPLDPAHFAATIDENVRAAESPTSWSVLETSPHLGSPDIDPGPAPRDDWRATPPADEAPAPPRQSTPSGLALENRLFGDLPNLEDELHRDVEAEALASVESSLAQDEELTKLEEDVRAEAQRRRQAREVQVSKSGVSSPTPVPRPPPTTPPAESSFATLSDEDEGPSAPSRPPTQPALSRAEQMLHEARAVADAQRRVDEADLRQRQAELEAISRRAEHAESLVRREREVRAALEEDLERLRVAATAHEQAALTERRAFDEERARAAAALEALHRQADSRLDEREAALTAQLTAAQRQLEKLSAELENAQYEAGAVAAQLLARDEAMAALERQHHEALASLAAQHEAQVADLERQLREAHEATEAAARRANSASATGAALAEEQRAHHATRAAASAASEAAALALSTEQQAHHATRAAAAAALDAEHRAHAATREDARAALEAEQRAHHATSAQAQAALEAEQQAHQATRDEAQATVEAVRAEAQAGLEAARAEAHAALELERAAHHVTREHAHATLEAERQAQQAALEAERQAHHATRDEARRALEFEQRAHRQTQDDANAALDAEQRAHDTTREALAAAEARAGAAASDSDAFVAEQAAHQVTRQALAAAEARATSLEAEREQLVPRLSALEATLTTLQASLAAAAADRQQLEAEAQAALAEARSTEARLDAEKAGLVDELERANQRVAVAAKELAVARDALDTVRSRADEAEATATLATEKVRELESKNTMPLALPGRRALGMARHGTVTLEGAAQVICQLVISSADVRVELGAAGGTRTLWLKKGQIIAAASTFEAESLIDRARRDGLIDSRQERELRLLRTATLREQLDALKRRGFIRDIESVPLVQRCAEQIALAALSEDSSQYRLSDEAVPPEVLPVTVPRATLPLLAEALRRAVPVEALLEQLGGGEAVPAATDAELDLRALGFSDRERKMLAWADGEATVEDLSLASGLKPDAAFRALLVAKLLGVITVTVPASPRVTVDAELDVRRLEAKYDEVQDADYFTILGLPRAASADDVQRAWQRLSTEFHPLRFSGHADAGLQQRAQVVYGLLEEAMRALEDDRRRVEYARHLLD